MSRKPYGTGYIVLSPAYNLTGNKLYVNSVANNIPNKNNDIFLNHDEDCSNYILEDGRRLSFQQVRAVIMKDDKMLVLLDNGRKMKISENDSEQVLYCFKKYLRVETEWEEI